MPSLLDSEIKWFNSTLQSWDTPASNGGRCSETENVSGVANNVMPNVSAAQRANGVIHRRKLFIGPRNASNIALVDPKISIEVGTPGDSHYVLYPGTQTDTEDTRSARPYGYATLASDADSAATTISVTTEADWSGDSAGDQPFQAGDTIRIDARATVEDSGDHEYAEIATVSYSGTALQIGLTAGLENSYTAAGGIHVASVIEPGTIEAKVQSLSVSTTGSLTFNDAAYPIIVPQAGGIYQVWTVTVTDHTTGELSVSGDTVGLVGTGAMGANLNPANPIGGQYFQLNASAWGGTPATGDTLTFTTVPARTPVWYDRIIPAGAASIASDPVSVCVEGESAF